MTEIEKKALALVERLRGLFEKATPGDLNTAERHTLSEYVECPMCGGDGEVGATDYCNFDGVALGVQFYGIGKEFGAHEKLWSELIKSTPVMLDLIETQARENERLRRDRDDLFTFAKAIQIWRSDADSYDRECDHPQRNYCEDVELMEGCADIVVRQVTARAALGESHED